MTTEQTTWVTHIIAEGARFHVISWSTRGRHCSEPRCEINRPAAPIADSLIKLTVRIPPKKRRLSHAASHRAKGKVTHGARA